MKLFLAALGGGIIGGAAVWLGQTQSFHLVPVGMTYAELTATLLATVSVIVTILGVAIGALAIWGYP